MNNNGYGYNPQRQQVPPQANQGPGNMNIQMLQQQLAALSPQEREQILRMHPQLAGLLQHARRAQQQQPPQQPQQSQQRSMNANIVPQQMGNQGMPYQQNPQGNTMDLLNRQQQQQHQAAQRVSSFVPQGMPQARNTTPISNADKRRKTSVQPPIGISPVEASATAERVASLHHWSDKLKADGKEVPLDVLLYEQIIDRDHNYQKLLAKETQTVVGSQNRALLARLVSDLKYYSNLKVSRLKTIQDQSAGRLSESIWGEGYQGYGNGFTSRGTTHIVLPHQRKSAPKVREHYISVADMEKQAESVSELVPIRLEFDIERDKFKLSDTFLWDINDRSVSIETFVAHLVHDYNFKKNVYSEAIVASIKEQLNEYRPMVYPPSNYSRLKSEQRPLADVRIPIKLEITIGNNQLVDQFEWDINNSDNDPEEFSRVLCEEMGLPGEFLSAISHSIREQSQMFVRSLYLVGYLFDGSSVEEEEIRRLLKLPINTSNIRRPRYLLSDYTPQLSELSVTEMERLDKDKEREARRKRRGQGRTGRRNGPTLPDLTDVPKTYRTPVPSSVLPGGVDLGPPADAYEETVVDIETPQDQLEAFKEKMEKDRLERQALMEKQYGSSITGYASENVRPEVILSHQYGSSLNVKIKFHKKR
ncbi:unnamed protein product [Kuraishia capsulata CBS 1993]|uniref:Uncharacterized protein n=1 Tax=Kuraishia capsulata CBS 1993 TaxID=1382522 RepID=W6MY23_9ASCO|nr:uncharacterized protein KUCA_T00005879001 [Kuraishia capsulata CBS 1993]CDK29885.1 unnamed protein product [Kuraishia capsulata CBS 1993]